METSLVVSEWKMTLDDKKQPTIAGKYQVKLGQKVISETVFNSGFNTTTIIIPPEILVEVTAISDKVKEAIINNFTN